MYVGSITKFIFSSNVIQIVFHTNTILLTMNFSKLLFVNSLAISQSCVKKVVHTGRLSATAVSSAASSLVTRDEVLQQLLYPKSKKKIAWKQNKTKQKKV
jgi:hypothetical protein